MTKLINNLILISFLIINVANGQNMKPKIEELIAIKLIDTEQKEEMIKFLSRYEHLTKGTIIYSLFQIEFKKETGYKYSSSGTFLDFEGEKLKENEQNRINTILLEYLKKLKTLELINHKQFQYQSDRIANNKYIHLFHFLPDLINQVYFEEWMSVEKLDNYRKKLFENRIISKKENELLKSDIKNNKLESPFQFIDYCEKARFFDLSKYSNSPKNYLEQIHKLTSEILPELNFTDFKYEIKIDSSDSYNGYIPHYLIVSIKSNEKTYKMKSFISPHGIEGNNYFGKIDNQEYYKIFNKVLKDTQSPYQLHLINSNYNYNYKQRNTHQYFGIVALKKEQLEMFRYLNSYWELSYENFNNSLTTKKINKAIQEYQELGLFNHLNNDQINKNIEDVKEKMTGNLNELLFSFPDIIVSFDYELYNLENPYEEIVSEYSKISHQEFNPTNIKDNFRLQKEKVSLSFNFNGKSYKTEFKINRDWIDERFFDFMDKIIVENKLNGQFYKLNGEGFSLIYLTPEQYKYIKEKKLLVFADED